jgi:two-component system, LytTR family, sensor kinase
MRPASFVVVRKLLHRGPMADLFVIAQVVGCGVGGVLSLFLARLASRSQEKGRGARILYAACLSTFYIGGVMHFIASLTGSAATLIDVTGTLRFWAAALWPMSAIGMWLDDDGLSTQRRYLGKLLFRFAMASAVLIILAGLVAVWIVPRLYADTGLSDVLPKHLVHNTASYNGFLVIGLGVLLLVRNQGQGRFQLFAVWTMLAGLSIGTASIVARDYFPLPQSIRPLVYLAKELGLTLLVIGSLFYFARFRAVDVFLKLSLRLFAGVTLALAAAGLAVGPIEKIANVSTAPLAFKVIGLTALIGFVVLLTQRVSRITDTVVERHIFRTPNYRQAAGELQERLALLESVSAVIAETEEFVGRTLGMLNVSVHPSPGPSEDVNAEDVVRAPILVGNQSEYVLTVSSRSRQHIVMTVDVEFLRNVAVIVGRRLEALARERDRVERGGREAQLVHQVVSAELRALRAQLNPHFLFNALNTIAALIPHEPEKAELMVVRLAKVFRHLLTHSEKSFSSLQEEIEFLQTYLEIEKVRFGERLTVEFEIGEAVATATVPSLILQPLVENALKHGLAPKRGDNQLIIRADRIADALSLSVEDNGIGISNAIHAMQPEGSGVGLRNIRERLRTIYGNRASLVLENIAQGGSRASVIIPVADTI